MEVKRDPEFEKALVGLMVYLKETKQECHTKLKGGSFIIVKRRPSRSRLTGELK